MSNIKGELNNELSKAEARRACGLRKHLMGPWEETRISSIAKCEVCSKEVCVTLHPAPNDIAIGGSAVVENCFRSRRTPDKERLLFANHVRPSRAFQA